MTWTKIAATSAASGLIGLLSVLCEGLVHAEPPHVSYIFPAGGQAGTTVPVHVGGHYLHEGAPFEISGAGVTASPRIERTDTLWFEGPVIPQPDSQRKEDYPKDYFGSIEIAPDAEPGDRYWRVSTAQGITSRMKFVVGTLPEIVEQEIDGRPIAVPVPVPVTINGRIFPREDVDAWSFEAQAGEVFSCDVVAQRIGSPLDSRLVVLGPDGQPVAENIDTFGADSFVTFTAPQTGTYQLQIHDINFDGLQHFVYRLSVQRGAAVRSVFPAGGRAGTEVTLELASTLPESDSLPATVTVPIPADVTGSMLARVSNREGGVSTIRLAVGEQVELREVEPNDAVEAVTGEALAVPSTWNGRIQTPGDVDLWKFTATEGATLQFDVLSADMGAPLDAVIEVLSADGKSLANNDDRANTTTDSRLQWKVPAGDFWFLSIRDQLASRGDDRFVYRLQVTEQPASGFGLTLPSDTLVLDRGKEAKLRVTVDRSAGYAGEIELELQGLPAGVTVENTTIGKNRPNHDLLFKAEGATSIGLSNVQIVGRSVATEAKKNEPAVDPGLSAVATFPTAFGGPSHDGLDLFVAIPTPFIFSSPFETRYASRGTVYSRRYTIERNGFEGPIEVELADRQNRHLQGVTGSKIVVPPGESEFEYAVALPPWMEIGRTSRSCLMVSGFVEDGDGTRHRVTYTSEEQNDQIIVLVDPARLSVSTPDASVGLSPGQSLRLPITVKRGPGIQGGVKVRIRSASHITGWEASEVEFAGDREQGEIELRLSSDKVGPFNMPLILEATARDEQNRPVIDEFPLAIRLLSGESVTAVTP